MKKTFFIALGLFLTCPFSQAEVRNMTLAQKKLLQETTNLINSSRYFDGEMYALTGSLSSSPQTDTHAVFAILRAISLWKLGDTARALEILKEINLSPSSELKTKADFYYHWILLTQGDNATWNNWVEKSADSLKQRNQEYFTKIKEADLLPKKSALATGIMSAILPGLGHARLGLWQDAALTFALNALFIGTTIEFARNNQTFGAIAAGSVGSFFYVGGIVSAVKLTEAENNGIEEKFLHENAFKIFPELRLEF